MKKLFTLKAFVFLLVILGTQGLKAQLAGWDFDPQTGGVGNYGVSPLAATTTGSNVVVGSLTRGSGISTGGANTGSSNAWGGFGFITSSPSLANAITANEYVTFTIKANSSYSVSISGIDAYNIRRSGSGPITGQWQYSINGSTYTNIGSSITWGTTTTAAGNAQGAIDLTGVTDLQDVSSSVTITFRLVTWGATNSAGTWYLNDPSGTAGDDFVVNGSTTALPIELLSLTAADQSNHTLLSFATASERNNARFEIERSADGRTFQVIGAVKGAGDAQTQNNYTFTDEHPMRSINYYRLRQVDFDGASTLSQVVSVNFDKTGNVVLYPTPASETMNVRFDKAFTTDANWQIVDLSGRILNEGIFAAEQTEFRIPVASLTQGAYILRVTANNEVLTQQFRKQ